MNVEKHSINALGAFTGLWENRSLVWEMTKREVLGKYRGSFMGVLWSLFNPIFMLAIYTFVFGVVFRVRWGGETLGQGDFALVLFSGMLIHSLFSECINRAPSLVLSNANYVKKVVFPLHILPLVIAGAALFHTAVSALVLLILFFILHHYINWTIVFLPLILIPFLLLTLGLSWMLAAIGVYLRDIGQTTVLLTTALLFLSPVFYPVSALPEAYRPLLHANPLTFIIEQTRNVLLWGTVPDWKGLGIYALAGLITAVAGLLWFQKARRGFADVL